MSHITQHWIDLRSDTVTQPSEAMRDAMASAPVGDDVYGDDPTVNRLQDVTADMFGYEAALFAPSGTQSNLIALLLHCARGDEYLVGQEAHTYKYEGGGAAVLGSIQPQPIANQPDGSIALKDIAAYIKPDDMHFARTRLLALENTIGGKVLGVEYMASATDLARSHGLATHLDGARICNAAVKQGLSLREAVKGFDSVSVCLSKGLGAPVGSVLCGPKSFIEQGKRWRKMLGGGMRQRLPSSMNAFGPHNTEPTGAPRPLDRHTDTVSKPAVAARRLMPCLTAALQMRAPSRCVFRPRDLASDVAAAM